MSFKWKPSKKAKIEFAEKMKEIEEFCKENNIHQSSKGDSYYFILNNTSYRVSNHTTAASNKKAYNWLGEKVREEYHDNINKCDIEITASKTRIIEIFNNLKSGKKLDKRGNIIQ